MVKTIPRHRLPVILLGLCLGLGAALPAANAVTATVLTAFQFSNALGQFPQGALALGSDGNFYGVTTSGAANGDGAAFKVTPAGAVTKLVDLTSATNYPFGPVFGTDGNLYDTAYISSAAFKVTVGSSNTLVVYPGTGTSPHASLVLGSDGNFYGTTEESGTGGDGTVFKMTTGGQITRLASFPGPFVTPAIGAYPDTALVEGSAGTFYGTTINGANGTGTIYRVTSAGTLTLFYTFTATTGTTISVNSDGAGPNDLVYGSDGNLYGTTKSGGTYGYGTVYRITTAGAFATLYAFDGVQAGSPDTGLVQANDGNFYGTSGYIGAGNEGVVFRMTPSGTLTVLAPLSGDIAGASKLIQGRDGKFYGTSYAAGATNAGSVFVVDAGLPIIQNLAPSFTLPPAAQAIATGRSVVFNAIAAGYPAPTYQWKRNGVAIAGATDAVFKIAGATSANAGTYTCTATNSTSSVTSASATLSVATTSTPGFLSNLSARAQIGTGNNILIGGYATGGTGTKQLLVRGVGPALAAFFGAGALATPQLTLLNGGSVIASNTNWAAAPTAGPSAASDSPMVAASLNFMNNLGAFQYTAGSLDTAMVVTAPTANSTAQVSGVGGATGIGLVEFYDADTTTSTCHLVNISARAQVGTGNSILIGGFAIGGSTAETLLIRAVGPGLNDLLPGSFPLSTVLTQPVLTIFQGGTAIYSNTVWGGDATIAAAFAPVGAFALNSAHQDSVLLVTLAPGNYTAQVSGLNGGTGIALCEIYEVQ